ncbi:MAG: thiamine diphosphokinase [Treponema sp.]|jgi:thiamine pyrophosphokinase|nr:thiamine diphosphokinase [Treponema sp.]
MRGIAFIGGEGPRPEWRRSLCAEVLSGGETLLVAADSGLIAAEAAGLWPDWVVGDMDSLGDAGLAQLDRYPPERVLRYAADKDFTDTELALRLLWEKGCTETWLIGGGGGRLDHLLAIRSLFERERCPSRWITAAEDIRCVEAGGNLRADVAPPHVVSVFPAGPGPWAAESEGLKWPLAGLTWDRGFFGVSNAAEAGGFSVRVKQGRFLVILPLAAAMAGL